MNDDTNQLRSQAVDQPAESASVDELQRREQAYRLLVENTNDVIWSLGLDLQATYISPSVKQLLGFSPAEAMARGLPGMMTVASIELVRKTLAELQDAVKHDHTAVERVETLELELIRKNGSTRWVEVRASLLRDGANNPTGIIGITRDISDRKRAEEALHRSEQRYRVLTETTSDWVWEVDKCAIYTYASPKIRGWLGYEPEELIGRTPFDFMPPEEARRVAEIFGKIAGCHVPFVALENTVRHKNGSLVVVETSGVPMFNASGDFLGYQGCDCDVTDRKRAEKQLKDHADMLEYTNRAMEKSCATAQEATKTRNELLAKMSRESRTPLAQILNSVDALLENLRSPTDIEVARTIKRNSVHLLNVINGILDMSKGDAESLAGENYVATGEEAAGGQQLGDRIKPAPVVLGGLQNLPSVCDPTFSS